ncbi:hypothetical protein [Thermogymnomonas acidicola]|nr:hypothetical protein [Thermogymnomonas acidicola]
MEQRATGIGFPYNGSAERRPARMVRYQMGDIRKRYVRAAATPKDSG